MSDQSSRPPPGPTLFVLERGVPVPAANADAWIRWFAATPVADRTLARDELPGGVTVATFFHGTATSLWETMIFGGPLGGSLWRWPDRDAADAGHREAVRLARAAGEDPFDHAEREEEAYTEWCDVESVEPADGGES